MTSSNVPKASYRVGIDLGTTHTVVAFQPADAEDSEISLFSIPQLIAPGEVGERPLLPSARYHPAHRELAAHDLQLPWPQDDSHCQYLVGEMARNLGAKTRGRLITSAKSWLSHDGVDRMAAILPWAAVDDVQRISPVTATASYLNHVRHAWNRAHENAPLEQQQITITIPASFDEIARNLTLEAARQAGLPGVRLLEEPQAASYDWLWRNRHLLADRLHDIRLLLVCDIGGGTCDFTLIKVQPGDDGPTLTRVAVGEHLMLGGDNIDLALAHRLEPHLSGQEQLSAADFAQLIEQCRAAKERLLADNAPQETPVTLLAGGRRLIGGARSAPLSRAVVEEVLLDGFLPLTSPGQLTDSKRSGMVTVGLPYAHDPVISHHIAEFLHTHQAACRQALESDAPQLVPDGLLLNGGLFNSRLARNRIVELLASWRGTAPELLENDRPDLAVAYGAVAHAAAAEGNHRHPRIGGGSARSYFLVMADEGDEHRHNVCLLPQGTPENSEIRLTGRIFALRLGEPVSFNLVTRVDTAEIQAGEILQPDERHDQILPPLFLQLPAAQDSDTEEIQVELISRLTEVGTLQVQCVSIAGPDRRWDLEFQLRGNPVEQLPEDANLPDSLPRARELIERIFGKKTRDVPPKAVKSLRADLEKLLGPREEWDTPLLRALFDSLWQGHSFRRRTANHERLWLSLTGYCLRPGFGYPGDEWRSTSLWPLYRAGVQYVNETQVWAEWWTLWRRVAGGLDGEQQKTIYDDISGYLNPARARQGKIQEQGKKRSYDNMVRLVATLERLPVKNKIEAGEWLLKRLQKPSEPQLGWWALGRLGTRIPWHGSEHGTVAADTAATWLQAVLARNWKQDPQIAFAAVQLARVCNDRERDLPDSLRKQVLDALVQHKCPESWQHMVSEFTELDEASEKRIFGEALPPGLRLVRS